MACGYGRANVVDFLLEHGVDVDSELRGHGDGHTGLHLAAFHGQVEVVKTLVRHGARVDVIDKTWGTPPLVWALTGWGRKGVAAGDGYYAVVAQLVGAGATVTPDVLAWDKLKADPKMLSALTERPPKVSDRKGN
jgi:ankyrin repeat protein